MPAPQHVNFQSIQGFDVTSVFVTMDNVVAGNLLYSLITLLNSDFRNFDTSDPNNTWNSAVTFRGNSRNHEVEYAMDVAGGTTVVTSTISTSDGRWEFGVGEISGASATDALDGTGTFADPVGSNSHPCAELPGLDVSANSYVVTTGIVTASTGSNTPAPNFIELVSFSGNEGLMQYRTSDPALVDERAIWETSTLREGSSIMAAFVADAAPPAGAVVPPQLLQGY